MGQTPHLVLLDYVLPDMKGHEVLNRLLQNPATAKLPVVYMSGFGTDLPSDPHQSSNVIGSLHKPFTSELLLSTVATFMPNESSEAQTAPTEVEQSAEQGWASDDNLAPAAEPAPENIPTSYDAPPAPEPAPVMEMDEPAAAPSELASIEAAVGGANEAWWEAPPAPQPWDQPAGGAFATEISPPRQSVAAPAESAPEETPIDTSGAYFCGDTTFFSLNWALHTIAAQKLTGTLRCFWDREPVELLARGGRIILATTRDPDLYCSEAPITLVNIDEEHSARARQQQRETGRPLFITLAQENLILREPAVQLVQHYGQKLFAQLWTGRRVRIMFEQAERLPSYADEIPSEEDVDHWALSTLRFIQFTELGDRAEYDPASIPAYTRDGFERVQHLRLTVAEAQFASQFNGVRSIAQIAKNLRLDLKFARLTLFRFIVLEIVECWPPAAVGVKPEKRGVFGRMFGE